MSSLPPRQYKRLKARGEVKVCSVCVCVGESEFGGPRPRRESRKRTSPYSERPETVLIQGEAAREGRGAVCAAAGCSKGPPRPSQPFPQNGPSPSPSPPPLRLAKRGPR